MRMNVKAGELADLVHGKIKGESDVSVQKFSPIEDASKGSLSFISNPKYGQFLYNTKASVVIVPEGFEPEKKVEPTLLYVRDVYSTLSKLLERFNHIDFKKSGIEPHAHIHPSAKVGNDVYIANGACIGENVLIEDGVKIFPNTFIGDECRIGQKTMIYSGNNIYRNTKIGKNCIIHSGCSIGSDGFGFAPQKDGSYLKMPQTGNVIIEDNVEIGANCTIDRATIKSTFIRKGVKLDNLIQVAHNVDIGENTAIAAQTGISGSTKIGKNCVIGGQVGIVGHITIADGSKIGAQSGVSNSIKEKNKKWFGSPVQPVKEGLKASILFKKLPDLYNRLAKLEKFVSDFDKKSLK